MFDTTFLHARNVVIHTQRCTFWKDYIGHLSLCILYEDKLLGGLVGKGLDFVSHIVVLWKDALDGICLISGSLAVQFNLFATFCLVEHIYGIVDIPLQYINETRILFQLS